MIKPYSSAIAYLFWDTEMNDRARRLAVRRQMWMPMRLYVLSFFLVLPAIIVYLVQKEMWDGGKQATLAMTATSAFCGPVALLLTFIWRAVDSAPARWLQARRADLRQAGHTGSEILAAALEPGLRGAVLVSGLHIAFFMLMFVIAPAVNKAGEIPDTYLYMLIFLAPVIFLWLTATPLDVALWSWTDSWLVRLGAMLLLLFTSPMLILTVLNFAGAIEELPGEKMTTLIIIGGWFARGAAVWKIWQTAGVHRGR